MIPALVLTAGLATRLRPLSLVRAKAAFPVAGKPIIHRILQSLAAAGVTDAVLNLHHLPHTLTRLVGDGAEFGMRVRYSWEVPLLGSAGGPRRALPILDADCFLIINGDTLSTMDLGALVDQHRRSGALVTLGVVPNIEPHKYSGVSADENGFFTGVVPRGSDQPSYHFTFAQVADAAAFDSVPVNTPWESIKTLYPVLVAARPDAVQVFTCRAEYDDIRAPTDYLETSLRLENREGQRPTVGSGSRIEPTAQVERSILWDDVVVEAGAMLKECVITDGVRVPAETSWHGVTMRVARGELTPGEKRIDDLFIAAL